MRVKLNEKLIRRMIQSNNATDLGVFISVLSYEYIRTCNITKKQFFTSLRNSFKIIEEEANERDRKNNE